MVKKCFILFIFSMLLLVGPVFGQVDTDRTAETAFELSAAVDIPLAVTGAALILAEYFIEPVSGVQHPEDQLIFPDRFSVFPYNSGLDTASDLLFAGSLILPAAAMIGQDLGTIAEVGVMFIETLALTLATKDIIKDLVPRFRPYTYHALPASDDDDYMNSFPSGHTSMVFAVCSFSAYVFAEMFPDSKWKLPIVIGAYSIAAVTGILRIVSGNHFITDVLAGSLIGTAYGIGIPLLHQIRVNEDTELAVRVSAFNEPAVSLVFRI